MSDSSETPGANDRDAAASPPVASRAEVSYARRAVIDREKEQFGGMRFGCALFGWLTATGTTAILAAIATGVGVAVGLDPAASRGGAAEAATADAGTVGILGAIVLGVILLVAYYCGGYVAGRMARFSGLKQGLAVWLWALVILLVVTIVGVLAGGTFDLSGVAALPSVPADAADLTFSALLGLVGALAISLVGALLGGVTGMRFHRRVDIAGLGR